VNRPFRCREEAATAFVAEAEATVAAVEEAVADVSERPTVLALERYQGALTARGGAGIFDEIIRLAGGENAFGDVAERTFDVNAEQVVAADADVLVYDTCCGSDRTRADTEADLESLAADPAFADLRAIRDGRVLVLDFADMDVSPRTPDVVEELVRFLHPDRFDP